MEARLWTARGCLANASPMKTPRQDIPRASDRKDRLKEALKANIARRKAQARSRAVGTETPSDEASPDDAAHEGEG